MDLNYLRYFYYVAVHGGFTRAAENLHVQQPVISRAVKLLESQLGFRLIERQKKKSLLTPEGREIFEIAEKIFLSAEQIANFSKEHQGLRTGDLNFATSESLSLEIIGPISKKITLAYPDVRFIHHSTSAQLAIDSIRSNQIEFGVFFNLPELPSDLISSKLALVPFEFVVLKSLSKEKKILESFIAPVDESSSRISLFQKYKSQMKSASLTALSNSPISRKSMALSGVGVTALPRFLVKEDIKAGTLKSVTESKLALPLFLIERKSSYKSKLKSQLISQIKLMVEA